MLGFPSVTIRYRPTFPFQSGDEVSHLYFSPSVNRPCLPSAGLRKYGLPVDPVGRNNRSRHLLNPYLLAVSLGSSRNKFQNRTSSSLHHLAEVIHDPMRLSPRSGFGFMLVLTRLPTVLPRPAKMPCSGNVLGTRSRKAGRRSRSSNLRIDTQGVPTQLQLSSY